MCVVLSILSAMPTKAPGGNKLINNIFTSLELVFGCATCSREVERLQPHATSLPVWYVPIIIIEGSEMRVSSKGPARAVNTILGV